MVVSLPAADQWHVRAHALYLPLPYGQVSPLLYPFHFLQLWLRFRLRGGCPSSIFTLLALAICPVLYYNQGRVKGCAVPTTTYEDENLRKNGVSRLEVQEVFASDLSYAEDLEPSDRGNDRAMVIGWTYTGRILEIGIEYFEIEAREHVFH